MLTRRLQPRLSLSSLQVASARGWLSVLLLASIPGAMLACILHCTVPAHGPHQHNQGLASFICAHALDDVAELPQPMSTTLVQNLVQGLAGATAPMVAGLVLLHLAVMRIAMLVAQPADAPPEPPPRPRP